MSIETAAQEILEACKAIDEELEVTFDASEITIYWWNMRLDVQPEDLKKALKIIKDAKALGARFE